MKKLFLVAVVMMASVCAAHAQQGSQALGVNVLYGSEISNVGLGVQYQYSFTDNLRLAPSFDYFLEKDGMKMWDINANLHYVFNVSDKFNVYPLAGIGYAHFSGSADVDYGDEAMTRYDYGDYGDYDDDEDDDDYEGGDDSGDGKILINLGCGAEYGISDKLSLCVELKYQIISDANQFVPSIGLKYRF